MKRILVLMFLLPVLLFSSCTKEDLGLSEEFVTGKWNVVWASESTDEGVDFKSGMFYIVLNANGGYTTVMITESYKGAWSLDGNTVVGVTVDGITEYYKFKSLSGNTAEIEYTNTEGDKFKFRVIKE